MTDNGTLADTITAEDMRRVEDMVFNVASTRAEIFRQLLDPRRDIDDECGHPPDSDLNAQYFRTMFERNPIARRVVELMGKECWQVTPQIFASSDTDKPEQFDLDWAELRKTLRGEKSWFGDETGNPIFGYLKRLHIQAGIGRYGVLLMGFNDGQPLSEPVLGLEEENTMPTGKDLSGNAYPKRSWESPKDNYKLTCNFVKSPNADGSTSDGKKRKQLKLNYLRVFPEYLAMAISFEANRSSSRYGKPILYQLTVNDPKDAGGNTVGLTSVTEYVHWTRVIHVPADNPGSSEVFATEQLRPVVNNCLDLSKLFGASAEGYWQSCFTGLSFETHPNLGNIPVKKQELQDMYENYRNGLQRALFLAGMSAKTLAPQVVDPSPQIDKQLEAICIVKGCPVRVFKGSERGELASAQDDDNWNDRKREHNNNYTTPFIIVAFVDRLIQVGVLTEPEDSWHCFWPDLESLGDSQKAAIAVQVTTALGMFVSQGIEQVMAYRSFLSKVLAFFFDEEEIDDMIEEALKNHENLMTKTAQPEQTTPDTPLPQDDKAQGLPNEKDYEGSGPGEGKKQPGVELEDEEVADAGAAAGGGVSFGKSSKQGSDQYSYGKDRPPARGKLSNTQSIIIHETQPDEKGHWITARGQHIFVKEGQAVDEAFKAHLAKQGLSREDTKDLYDSRKTASELAEAGIGSIATGNCWVMAAAQWEKLKKAGENPVILDWGGHVEAALPDGKGGYTAYSAMGPQPAKGVRNPKGLIILPTKVPPSRIHKTAQELLNHVKVGGITGSSYQESLKPMFDKAAKVVGANWITNKETRVNATLTSDNT